MPSGMSLPEGVNRVLVFIDKARALLGAPGTPEYGIESFRFTRSAWPPGSVPRGLLFVLLDTMSSISNFSPSAVKDPSLNGKNLLPPFCLLDCMSKTAGEEVPVGGHAAPPIGTAETVARQVLSLGRPLWGSYLRQSQVEVGWVIKAAMDKLVLLDSRIFVREFPQLNDRSAALDKACAIAILGARACLQVIPRSTLAHTLVKSHLAICLEVSKDREALRVIYASEPIVAVAAEGLMTAIHAEATKWTKNGLVLLLDHLIDAVSAFEVDCGHAGELVARLVMLFAMDETRKAAKVQPWEPVRLHAFLDVLLGKDSVSLPKRFDDALINFTHFVQITFTPDSAEVFKRPFERTAALICRPNQPGIDMILPALLPSAGPGPGAFEPVSVKVKNVRTEHDLDWPASASSKLTPGHAMPNMVVDAADCAALYFNLGSISTPRLLDLPPVELVCDAKRARPNQAAVGKAVFGLDAFSFLDQCVRERLRKLLGHLGDSAHNDALSPMDRALVRGLEPLRYRASADAPGYSVSLDTNLEGAETDSSEVESDCGPGILH
eukprot:m.106943 g.106943  ORF g.106943 m.106943 type:complete len:551 (+) comp8962_c0_seq1:907-2559(+)